jgi:hypothetical protein
VLWSNQISIGVTQRRTYDCDFVIGKNALTKGIFAVALTEWRFFFNGKADKELKAVAADDGYITIGFRPDPVFIVAKSNDTRFSTKWEKNLVFFIVNTHIVGIALGTPFSPCARYSPSMIFWNVWRFSMPHFSS